MAPTLPPAAWTWRRAATPAFPLADATCRLFSQSRQGLWAALSRLRRGPGDEMLVPAYHHGSEVETVRAAGFRPRFYGSGDTVEPDEQELNALTGPATRGLYLIHALGLACDSPRWRKWCDRRDLALVEDAAQSWLSHVRGMPVGTTADVSIFCLYKTIGVPDGGAVRTGPGVPPVGIASGTPALGIVPVLRGHRRYLEQRTVARWHARKPQVPSYREDPARDFAPSPCLSHPSSASRHLAYRVAGEHVAARRRRNFQYLEERLAEHSSTAFGPLREGDSPLAFPITTDDKHGMLDHLARAGVTGCEAWTVAHPLLPLGKFSLAELLRDQLVWMPVHQELRDEDLEQIAGAASGWYARGRS